MLALSDGEVERDQDGQGEDGGQDGQRPADPVLLGELDLLMLGIVALDGAHVMTLTAHGADRALAWFLFCDVTHQICSLLEKNFNWMKAMMARRMK